MEWANPGITCLCAAYAVQQIQTAVHSNSWNDPWITVYLVMDFLDPWFSVEFFIRIKQLLEKYVP